MPDVPERVQRHVERFNAAVGSGDWSPFVAGLAVDAEMVFHGVAVPAVSGAAAILEAYRADPPSDTVEVVAVDTDADVDVVRFAWTRGGTGVLRLVWRGDVVQRLEVRFT